MSFSLNFLLLPLPGSTHVGTLERKGEVQTVPFGTQGCQEAASAKELEQERERVPGRVGVACMSVGQRVPGCWATLALLLKQLGKELVEVGAVPKHCPQRAHQCGCSEE